MTDTAGTPRLSLHGVHLGTRLVDVSFTFARGECVVLTGPNGAGKSSLLRVLLGLERPERGEAFLGEKELRRLTPAALAQEIAWLPQRPALAESRLVVELVAQARYRFREPEHVAERAAARFLEEAGAGGLVRARTDRISGGEFQRVLLAALLAQETPLLAVDEPGNHLDPKEQIVLYEKLGALVDAGRGLLLVTHDLRGLGLLGPPTRVRVVGVDRGRVRFSRTLDDDELPLLLGELYEVPHRSGERAGDILIDWGARRDRAPEGARS